MATFLLNIVFVFIGFKIVAGAHLEAGKKDLSAAHFKEFSHNLLRHSDLDEFSVEKGAAISSPFGVGYILANINEKVWNVSNDGINQLLRVPPHVIVSEEYASLIKKLEQGSLLISSTLFTSDGNLTANLTEGSRKMKTETVAVNFIEDWKSTWIRMNGKLANETEGILDDQLIPRGGWWGSAFYFFTISTYLNSNYFKEKWDTVWKPIGKKKFHDGLPASYFETEGSFPFLETDTYSAVTIKLKDGKKSVILAIPKMPFIPFLKDEMIKLVATDPKKWNSEKVLKIQIPALNITLLDQHYKKLEAMGVNYSICVDEAKSPEVLMRKGTHFMGPIVQSHHVQFNPDYFEVASATGSSLNSEEKMKREGIYHPPTEEEEENSENLSDGSEFVLPMADIDPSLIRALTEGELQLKNADGSVTTDAEDKNDTISSASSFGKITLSPSGAGNIKEVVISEVLGYPMVDNITTQVDITSHLPLDEIELLNSTISQQQIQHFEPVMEDSLSANTLRFDRPFFWYFYDEELETPLYYGTIYSLATYAKEYGIETDEDLWLYDAYKTLLW